MTSESIRVLLVDDDPLALELHRAYLERAGGFEVGAECATARAAVDAMLDPHGESDLVLLDVTMPDGTGLDVLRRARAGGFQGDVIAVSGVRDADTVRQMVALGCVNYLIKPFTFATFRERIEGFREYHRRSLRAAGPATQVEVDALFAALRPDPVAAVPKGLSRGTLAQVLEAVRDHGPFSASELGGRIGVSREVARRYLEHLADQGRLDRAARYGARGRPQTEYRWIGPGAGGAR